MIRRASAARLFSRGLILALVLLAILLSASSASATIRYTISLDQPAQHLFLVEMDIPQAAPGTEIAMPAWNALYQVRDFAERIRDMQAESLPQHIALVLRQLDKQTWRIESPSGAALPTQDVRVTYAIQWNDSGPFNSQLNDHHAFLNFAEVLTYLPNRRSEPTEVIFAKVPLEWKIAVQLTAGPDANSFVAPGYDTLVDAPAEIGLFEQFSFSSRNANFRVVVDSPDWNQEHLQKYLSSITAYEIDLMGGHAPFSDYTFFFHIAPDADENGGGMEHSDCTAIAASTTEGAATIAAHEFFHVWNVKRIRPRALEPVDYTKEQPTRALWFAEGVTSTYAAYALERTGLWTKDQFYSNLASQIQSLSSRPARKWQSVEESSLDAWFEKYDDYNQPDRSISYYNKGQIDGVMLDLAIRNATADRQSLDDVLRRMNTEYAQQGRFYDESGGIRSVVEEVVSESAPRNKDFSAFFRSYVGGIEEIPYETFLGYAGLDLRIETDKSADIGFRFSNANKQITVASIESESAAQTTGLKIGDVILEIAGRDAVKNSSALRESAPGTSLRLRIRRGAAESELTLVVGSRQNRRYAIAEIAHPSDAQRRIREGLLHGTTD